MRWPRAPRASWVAPPHRRRRQQLGLVDTNHDQAGHDDDRLLIRRHWRTGQLGYYWCWAPTRYRCTA